MLYTCALTAMNILSFILMAAIALPFVFLGALLLATYFDLAIANRLIDAAALSLQAMWIIGCVVNFAGGLALIAIGAWLPIHAPTRTHWLIGTLIVIPLGLWRTWRGSRLSRAGLKEADRCRLLPARRHPDCAHYQCDELTGRCGTVMA